MKKIYKTSFIVIIFFLTSINSYSQIGATYLTPTTGTLSGIPFTLNGTFPPIMTTTDLSGVAFSGAPLSNSEIVYGTFENISWSVTFDTPITNLRLYCISYRNSVYEFDQPFTILSGNSNFQNPNGNQLETFEFANGIIEFTNPITTLISTALDVAGDNFIAITFGLGQPLSIDDNEQTINDSLKLYPNPSNEYIKVSGLSKMENYWIYNTLGNIIKNGTISNDEKLNIKNLTNGIYFLKFNNGNVMKFIKF